MRGARTGGIAAMLLGALVAAGCAEPGGPTSESHAPGATVAGDETSGGGSIEGLVTDDEKRPIPGVFVTARLGSAGSGAEAKTDDKGRFAFVRLPLGDFVVFAERLGYESVARKVSVTGSEPIRLELVLVPVPVEDSFTEVFPRKAFYHLSQHNLNALLNSTNLNETCTGCDVTFRTIGAPQNVVIEKFGRHTVSDPLKPDSDHDWFYDFPVTRAFNNGLFPLPTRRVFDEGTILTTKSFRHATTCDAQWFCYQERRDIWITAFHDMDIPEGYTAAPPA